MKSTKILLCAAVAGATVFVAGVASATGFAQAGPGYFHISGTAITDKSTTNGQALVRQKFTTKDVLKLLANATEESWMTNKNSHLLYDRTAYNEAASSWYENENGVYGIFWVTNTVSHDSYRLDNSSTEGDYWSFIELDYNDWYLGFWDPFQEIEGGTALGVNYADSYVETATKDAGREIGSDAILYVHDDPYDFDYPDYGVNALFDNDNAAVIRGRITLTWNETLSKASGSISIHGSGDSILFDSSLDEYVNPVITGKAAWRSKGTEILE